MSKKRKKKKGISPTSPLDQIAATVTTRDADATNSAIQDAKLLRDGGLRRSKVDPDISQGNQHEQIEALKFNRNAARKAPKTRAIVTANDGRPHDPGDIEIRVGNKTRRRIQCKSSSSPKSQAAALSKRKYRHMDKVVNKGQDKAVKKEAKGYLDRGRSKHNKRDLLDTQHRTRDQTTHGNVKSGGTSLKESRFSAKHPRIHAYYFEAREIAIETGKQSATAAASTAIVTAGISAIHDLPNVWHGKMKLSTLAKNAAKNGGKAAKTAAITATTSVAIRFIAKKAGSEVFARGNIATAFGAGVVDAGSTLRKYLKGEIEGHETCSRLQATCASTAGSYFLNAGFIAIHGTMLGAFTGFGGYLLASYTYQACKRILDDANLAEQEAEKTETMLREAIVQMARMREQLQFHFAELDTEFENVTTCLDEIDQANSIGATDRVCRALRQLTIALGGEDQFPTSEDFDRFLIDGGKTGFSLRRKEFEQRSK